MDHGHEMLSCSFCGRGQHDTRKLIAGPMLYICDVCVSQGSEIAKGADTSSPGISRVEIGGNPGNALSHCNFCGNRHDRAAVMLTNSARKFNICDQCLCLCRDILADAAEEAKLAP